MKILQQKYPKGTFKGQVSDGRYINEHLYNALKEMAKAISKDMTFLGVCYSSTLEVGTGKSVFISQIGEAWTSIVNEMYKLNIPYDVNNIVWRPKQLIETSFKMPKYSFILLDEWEDAGYWSELGMTLRQFFRKCRQLNLFIMVIIPNFFQLPISYAISRSVFAIDVRFEKGFTRGYFSFYNFEAKKKLYIYGKKTHNYQAAHSTFTGRFTDGYGVEETEYRKRKREDMLKWEEEEPEKIDPRQILVDAFIKFNERVTEIPIRIKAKGFGISVRTASRWISEGKDMENADISGEVDTQSQLLREPIPSKVIDVNEEELLNELQESTGSS